MNAIRPVARLFALAALMLATLGAGAAHAQRAAYDEMIKREARANGVPEALVHRVIVRESRYNAGLIGRGGCIGLMQIKLGTARALGYTGTAEGLRDPATNLAYGIKYLAGAFRAANGDHDRAVSYYASGYYYAAKRQRQLRVREKPVRDAAAPKLVTTRFEELTGEKAAAR